MHATCVHNKRLFEVGNIAHTANVAVIAGSKTFLSEIDAALHNVSGFEHHSLVRSSWGGEGAALLFLFDNSLRVVLNEHGP